MQGDIGSTLTWLASGCPHWSHIMSSSKSSTASSTNPTYNHSLSIHITSSAGSGTHHPRENTIAHQQLSRGWMQLAHPDQERECDVTRSSVSVEA